jgi:hypothetical protein
MGLVKSYWRLRLEGTRDSRPFLLAVELTLAVKVLGGIGDCFGD